MQGDIVHISCWDCWEILPLYFLQPFSHKIRQNENVIAWVRSFNFVECNRNSSSSVLCQPIHIQGSTDRLTNWRQLTRITHKNQPITADGIKQVGHQVIDTKC